MFDFLMIVSVGCLGISLVLMVIGLSRGEVFGIGLLVGLIGFGILVSATHKYAHERHVRAYNDLRAEGWNVSNRDVKWKSDKVQIECVTFGMHKLNGHFRVTTKRPEDQGGGYVILKPSIQKKLAKVCP